MTTYQRLGDYIREVNVRNRELKVTNLLGVSISKEFMLRCLLDAMENYEDAKEETEELHDKLHDKLHDMFPELSEKAFEVLEVLKIHPGLKAEDIGVHVSLSERQVKTYLNTLKQAGLIVRVGSNKTGYWKVTY